LIEPLVGLRVAVVVDLFYLSLPLSSSLAACLLACSIVSLPLTLYLLNSCFYRVYDARSKSITSCTYHPASAGKIILPRASFVGHLAGIVAGYPLAWNLFNPLTPPVFAPLLLAGFLLLRQDVLPHRLKSSHLDAALCASISSASLAMSRWLLVALVSLTLCSVPLLVYSKLTAAPFRLMLVLSAWIGREAFRCSLMNDVRSMTSEV
jgi:hypothetical protein